MEGGEPKRRTQAENPSGEPKRHWVANGLFFICVLMAVGLLVASVVAAQLSKMQPHILLVSSRPATFDTDEKLAADKLEKVIYVRHDHEFGQKILSDFAIVPPRGGSLSFFKVEKGVVTAPLDGNLGRNYLKTIQLSDHLGKDFPATAFAFLCGSALGLLGFGGGKWLAGLQMGLYALAVSKLFLDCPTCVSSDLIGIWTPAAVAIIHGFGVILCFASREKRVPSVLIAMHALLSLGSMGLWLLRSDFCLVCSLLMLGQGFMLARLTSNGVEIDLQVPPIVGRLGAVGVLAIPLAVVTTRPLSPAATTDSPASDSLLGLARAREVKIHRIEEIGLKPGEASTVLVASKGCTPCETLLSQLHHLDTKKWTFFFLGSSPPDQVRTWRPLAKGILTSTPTILSFTPDGRCVSQITGFSSVDNLRIQLRAISAMTSRVENR